MKDRNTLRMSLDRGRFKVLTQQRFCLLGMPYLIMLQNWSFPQLHEDSNELIFMQDGAPAHFHLEVWRYLNNTIPQHWIGRGGQEDLVHCFWPSRSPDLTPCDFFYVFLSHLCQLLFKI
ncbi:hypothetical protein C0J52_06365 [Blattella germanica]|nr:hypothetical protein C0J52_06365 [Blattella germanica]